MKLFFSFLVLTFFLSSPILPAHHAPVAKPAKLKPFEWQNDKYYKELIEKFGELAGRELEHIVQGLNHIIDKESNFFQTRYNLLIEKNQERIVEWMKENVLTLDAYYQENQHSSYSDTSTDSDEDGWRNGIKRGFERESSSECSSYDIYDSYNSYDSYDHSEYDTDSGGRNYEEAFFEIWKIQKIYDVLALELKSSDDLIEKNITLNAIRLFLSTVHSGNTYSYSWLINEDVEGSLCTSEDFVESYHKELDMDKEILGNVLSGLWFDFDWEEFDIGDKLIIQKTFKKTLQKLLNGRCGDNSKKYLMKRLKELCTFYGDDFDAPFNNIPERFNALAKQKNWRAAMIEWSVYTTYRKLFSWPPEASPVHPHVHSLNRAQALKERMEGALERARDLYTKVYPHPNTTRIVFGKAGQGRAELDIGEELKKLKLIGRTFEGSRPKNAQNANVFVPELYLIISRQALHDEDDQAGQRFIPLPLVLKKGDKRAITRSENDVVFKEEHNSDRYYFGKAREDVKRGKMLQGASEPEALRKVNELINGGGVNQNTNLVHSERALIEALRDPQTINTIVETVVGEIIKSKEFGLYGVYGGVMLAYSTNTVCSYCTPSLIALQNSGEETDGFLNLLVKRLLAQKGDISFQVEGYDHVKKEMDWRQFRLSTFVTASINFDQEANDLADQGQHSHKKNNKAPKETHNPHAKLFFKNDEINIKPTLKIDEPARINYFFEFVGHTIHTRPPLAQNPVSTFEGAVFASGKNSWQGF